MSEYVLSWPSALCAVVVIAINTMSQPSGKVSGYPRAYSFSGYPGAYSFALRASPMLCMMQALLGLTGLIECVVASKTMKEGVLLWSTNRLIVTEIGKEAPRISKLRKLLLFLLAFGATLQVIKIFSTRGVLWTQVLCGTYLASFLMDALLLAMVPKDIPPELHSKLKEASNKVTEYKIPRYINAWMLIQSSIHAEDISTFITLIYHQNYLGVPARVIGSALGFSIHSIVNFCLVRFVFDLHFRQASASTADLLITGNAESIVYGIINGLAIQTYTGLFEDDLVDRLGMFLLASVPAVMLHLPGFKSRNASERERRIYHAIFGVAFVAMHILCAVLCYWQLYDAVDTYRPGWTKYLG